MIRGLIKRAKFLLGTQKIWRGPKKSDVLIYDRAGSDVLLPYFRRSSVSIMDVRNETLNMPVLMMYLIRRYVYKKKSHRYLDEYIKAVSPRVVVTLIDNDEKFYSIKHRNDKVKTIFVQNGIRGGYGDIFECLNCSNGRKYHVDYMFVFGSHIANKYREYVSGNPVVIGSFRNNHYKPPEKIAEEKSVLFISQFRPKPKKRLFSDEIEDNFSFDKKHQVEKDLVRFLNRYCNEKGLRLQICGNHMGKLSLEEYDFYREALGVGDWEFKARTKLFSSYEHMVSAGIIVFLFSTLGYEALSRNKKCVAFCVGGSLDENPGYRFGWPANFPDAGPFWVNRYDENKFKQLLDNIIRASDEEWASIQTKYVKPLIGFDPGNSKFIGVMKELGVPM